MQVLVTSVTVPVTTGFTSLACVLMWQADLMQLFISVAFQNGAALENKMLPLNRGCS